MDSWDALDQELGYWSASGRKANFWWRDDDATKPTAELDKLLCHADSVPIALSVIPARVTTDLALILKDRVLVTVLQHGWVHENRSHANGHSEYPGDRMECDVDYEFSEGRRRLKIVFGPQAIPVFVPPFNLFDDRFLPQLKAHGLRGISREGRRTSATVDGLAQANTHMSPIDWSTHPPSLHEDSDYIQPVLEHLRGRRMGDDTDEPTGLLTHHLDQPPRSWSFISQFVDMVSSHKGAEWLSAPQIFRL
jgi:hypothetical protein